MPATISGAPKQGTPTKLKAEFRQHYGTLPQIFRAPGRVNLIGEHTDYNDGFVMPVAIQLYAYVAIAPRLEPRIRIHSQNFDESAEFSLAENSVGSRHHWSDYLRGVTGVLTAQGIAVRGADMMIASEVPVGSGLGSSAAIEVASALALLSVAGRNLAPIEIARACQRADTSTSAACAALWTSLLRASAERVRRSCWTAEISRTNFFQPTTKFES